MKFQLSHLRKRLGLLFFFVLSFVFLTAYFFFKKNMGGFVLFFFVGGERRVISTLIRAFFSSFWEHQFFFVNQETYVCSSHHQYAIFFCFWPRTRDVVWITTFFSYKKLVNWVSFYSSGKIEGYFFSFNVIFVIWPIKFPSCLSKTEGSFLRDFWIMFHTHSKQNYEPRLFFP